MPRKNRILFLGAAGILGIQLAGSYGIKLTELPPVSPKLHELPHEFGPWNLVSEQNMEPDVVAYLRPNEYVDRNYRDQNRILDVNLFVAYFGSLKSGYGPHSPAACLPGAGWRAKRSQIIHIEVGSLEAIPVNEYVLEKDNQNLLVLYWYQNARETWAEDTRAKLFMLPDLLRNHRSDLALVRMITPLNPDKLELTRSGMLGFVRDIFPRLRERFRG